MKKLIVVDMVTTTAKEVATTDRTMVMIANRIVVVPGHQEGLRDQTMMRIAEVVSVEEASIRACLITGMTETMHGIVINMVTSGQEAETREDRVIIREAANMEPHRVMIVIAMAMTAGIQVVNAAISTRKDGVSPTMIVDTEIRDVSGEVIAAIRAIADLNMDQVGIIIPEWMMKKIMAARTEAPEIVVAHGITTTSGAAEETAIYRFIV